MISNDVELGVSPGDCLFHSGIVYLVVSVVRKPEPTWIPDGLPRWNVTLLAPRTSARCPSVETFTLIRDQLNYYMVLKHPG